jgi:hypothetical protein
VDLTKAGMTESTQATLHAVASCSSSTLAAGQLRKRKVSFFLVNSAHWLQSAFIADVVQFFSAVVTELIRRREGRSQQGVELCRGVAVGCADNWMAKSLDVCWHERG